MRNWSKNVKKGIYRRKQCRLGLESLAVIVVKYFVASDEKSTARLHPLFLSDGRKLRMLQVADPFKHWWSITETRFCAACEHLFIGRDIRFFGEDDFASHFECPTPKCKGGFADWQYPRLHL